jgi:hypothetical protein
MDFGFPGIGPAFDRDTILERNNARQLFACGGGKPHFRPIVQPQAIDLSVSAFVKRGNDAGRGQRFLGLSPRLFRFSRRGRAIIVGHGCFLVRLGRRSLKTPSRQQS